MIPDLPALSPLTLPAPFKSPYGFVKEPLCDYARGGIALLDTSQGINVKDWRIDLEDGVCTIRSEGSEDYVVENVSPESHWISFAFDQNMHYNVAYSVGYESYLYWYDAQSQRYVTTDLGRVKTPFLRMDDSRNNTEGIIDVVLTYLKDSALYIRIQSERFQNEYILDKHSGNKLLQCGPTEELRFQWKTTVIYPETLPCPQADTDLSPRERRYISDINDVHNMRMFQQEFQATRNKINFVYTEEEAAEFRDWYDNVLLHGGAWFYADWPTLHKDKEIAHRFVDQPKFEWLFGAHPGKMGRTHQGGGYRRGDDAVTIYKVSATIELYDRKVENVYKTEVYPALVYDDITSSHHYFSIRKAPFYHLEEAITSSHHYFSLTQKRYIYSDYEFDDDITSSHHYFTLTQKVYIYSDYELDDAVTSTHHWFESVTGRFQGEIHYNYMDDDIASSHHFIVRGEVT